jgi:taurine dioxygenase
MITVKPNEGPLGATVEGADLSTKLDPGEVELLRHNLSFHGVLRFPDQTLDDVAIRDFCARFGELDVVDGPLAGGQVPEVGILSNLNGDVSPGQGWHTDMSYMSQVAYANVLYAIEVPVRDGKVLGPTQFQNMYMAYADLPADFKEQYRDAIVVFDFEKFNDYMIEVKGSQRQKTSPAQRAKRPPARHPMFLRHPITAQYSLYANPGYAIAVDGLPESESDAVLAFLFEHQLQPKYSYTFDWTVGDVLMWDNLATIHQAVDDYRPDERRHMRRCRIKADPAVAQVAA